MQIFTLKQELLKCYVIYAASYLALCIWCFLTLVIHSDEKVCIVQATLDESLYELAGELVWVHITLRAFRKGYHIYIFLDFIMHIFLDKWPSLLFYCGYQVRFLLRSGREYEPTTTDSENLSPRFLGYFLFPSGFRRQSMDLKR